MNERYGILGCVVAVALVGGCDEAEDSRDYGAACAGGKCDNADEPPECAGGKCDDAGDTDTGGDDSDSSDGQATGATPDDGHCPSDENLIEMAREQLYLVSVEYENVKWEPGRVESFQDLDQDGVKERLVFPGGVEGKNEDRVLYLSRGRQCADDFAGTFWGYDLTVNAKKDRTDDVLDLLDRTIQDCERFTTYYVYSGGRFVVDDSWDNGEVCED